MTNLAPTATAEAQADVSKAQSKARRSMVILYVVLTLLLLIYSLPTIGVLLTSLKTNAEISREGVWNLPDSLSLEKLPVGHQRRKRGALHPQFPQGDHPACVLSIAFGILTGYTLAKLSFRGSDILFVFLVSGLFFPPQIVMIRSSACSTRRGYTTAVADDHRARRVWHSHLHAGAEELLRHHPHRIREAASLTARTRYRYWLRVMLPLSLPSLAVLATLQFTWIWNDFLWPVIFTRSDNVRTVMFGLASLRGQYSVAYGTQSAMAIFASIPTLLIFIFFQKYFIRGLTLGSVKG